MPVVLAVTFGVTIVNGPIAPEALANVSELVPVTMPVPVIEPEPVAVIVSTVPETLALITMPLFVPVLIKANVLPAVTGPLTVMVDALPVSVSV